MPLPWTLHGDGTHVAPGEVVAPGERLSWPRTIGLGAQHVVAMFGATFLVPIITGFPPATTLFFSGLGTILFLLITRNRVPSYLGSSFAFIAPITAAMAADRTADPMGAALFGIVVVGILLLIVGLVVQFAGSRWIDALMPPVVAGAIVALIGLNLAPVARDNFEAAPLTALVTLTAVIVASVAFRGILGRMSILLGVAVGYVVAVLQGEVDFAAVGEAAWVGLPAFHLPANPIADAAVWGLLPAFLPVVLVLVAENVGHIRGVAQMTDASINASTGRALFADGLATTIAGFFGGSGTTTYGENIGVMAATRVYSTAAYWVAGGFAVLLGLSPKVGAVINTIPPGVLGGVTTALYGLIGIIGVKIWVDNRVDFTNPVNQFTAATALVVGIADFTFSAGDVVFNGIALGTIAAIVIYHLMRGIARLRGTATPAEQPATGASATTPDAPAAP
ncbi:NCS2 family nucleobase:cation symporter-2 [Agromyces flavus]|uniref:NCS2 family nucleobase:cation symporter-2 n=1 Tax=Agromyces flavus TaxID=589382 RepID=A0A1H1TIL7_9MICO|nr:solute carrier family 23 protein [Agromyces flavus]MCP2368419.1 NCS2 family nucleobase:cation symporter-2 [Agromyces flavus]GGI47879.1 nitrate reductase [Agromyces flavus]SDS59796.1 nucleobase:cation symporter-2, NCS2 family [Agromyces flavus]